MTDLDFINPVWFWHLRLFPNYIWVPLKSSCPREISFLPPPPSPPLHHHDSTTMACHLFTLRGLGLGMETGHKLKQFSKTQTRLLEETTSFLHRTLGRPHHSLNQWTHARTNFQTGTNLSLPMTDLCNSELSQIHIINTAE